MPTLQEQLAGRSLWSGGGADSSVRSLVAHDSLAGVFSGLGCGCPGCTQKATAALHDGGGLSSLVAGAAAAGEEPPQFIGDDIGDNTGSTTTIAVGGSLSSSIQHGGDLDYIRVSLVAGQTYAFSLTSGSLPDAYVELRTATGVLVGENDDGGIVLNSYLMYRPTQTGDYFIVARGFDASQIGSYTLTVNTVQTGNSSPTTFPDNGHPQFATQFSWEEAAIQISRTGASWASAFGASTVVTYAYRSTAPADMPDDTAGFSRFSAAQIAATEAALAAWASVANITFQRVNGGDGYSNNAAILFGNYNTGAEGAAAFAFLPSFADRSSGSVEGDIWINISLPENNDLTIGEYGRHVLLHEIGHALGLSHPGDYNAGPDVVIEYPTHAEYFNDSRMFTLMSYFPSSNTGATLPAFSSLPQLHDIAAIQRFYGANMASRAGDTIYGFNSNTGVPQYAIALASQGAVFAIWDGGGLDTLDLSGYATNSTIDLRPEAFSSAGPADDGAGLAVFNISIARGVTIENAVGGSGNDTIIGNDAGNTLSGGDGADTLTGGVGNDTLAGGAGADAMSGGAGGDAYNVDAADTVTELVGEGIDTVRFWSSSSYTLPANVENLTLMGLATNSTGNALDNIIVGNERDNTISGGSGNDTLVGGVGNDTLAGGAGADAMSGGAGGDAYNVDTADTVTELVGEGIDTVRFWSSSSYTLPDNVENLMLMGLATNSTGNALDNIIVGNERDNTISGGSGNDTLVGGVGNDTLAGGAGADAMSGGAGGDAYNVDAADTVTELVGEGIDTVRFWSSSSYTLPANIENLTLMGLATNSTGNALDNIIVGNERDNTISGRSGNDTLVGGAGNDTFVFDTPLGPNNVDSLTDFSAANDVIRLDTTIFAAISDGVLNPGAFRVGASAVDSDDRIIYDDTTGALYYDADGAGGAAHVQLAALTAGLALTNEDFFGFGP